MTATTRRRPRDRLGLGARIDPLPGVATPLVPLAPPRYPFFIMRCRRVALLVMIYVALDLANPMMPGAVQLIGPTLEIVVGCAARSIEPLPVALPSPMAACDRPALAHALQPRAQLPVIAPVSSLRNIPFRVSIAPRRNASSSPDGD